MSYELDGDALVRASSITSGVVLGGKYRLVRPAGFGGMAEVWIAENQATGAQVCVKILVAPEGDGDSVARFEREARAAAGLSHRAIVRTYDLFEATADLPEVPGAAPARKLAIVMDLLQGETLADRIDREGKLSLEDALDTLLPVVSGLSYAHKKGIVHRDVKPENVFLAKEPDGAITPKVLDFGLSKTPDAKTITLDGELLGTPAFMSPEQVRNPKDVDARSDVFSLGLLFYLALTGKNPFDQGHSVIASILEVEPPRIEGLPDAVWSVLARALVKDRAERFNDATELGIALRRAAGRAIETDPGATSGQFAIASSARAPLSSNVSVPPPISESIPIPAAALTPSTRRRRAIVIAVVAGAALIVALAALRVALSSSPSARAPESPSRGLAGPGRATAPDPPAPSPSADPAPPPAPSATHAPSASPATDPAPPSADPAPPPAPREARKPASTTTPPAPPTSATLSAPQKPPPGPTGVATDPGF
ncbi:MAG: serine/threonine-protein kinase [Polyangiaceae bacterium]